MGSAIRAGIGIGLIRLDLLARIIRGGSGLGVADVA